MRISKDFHYTRQNSNPLLHALYNQESQSLLVKILLKNNILTGEWRYNI
jgi:hypothetical protein